MDAPAEPIHLTEVSESTEERTRAAAGLTFKASEIKELQAPAQFTWHQTGTFSSLYSAILRPRRCFPRPLFRGPLVTPGRVQ